MKNRSLRLAALGTSKQRAFLTTSGACMKMIMSTFVIFLFVPSLAMAQYSSPDSCVGSPNPMNSLEIEGVAVELLSRHLYYMTSASADAGGTYEERRKNFENSALSLYEGFLERRSKVFREARCTYSGADWNSPGKSSTKTLALPPQWEFIPETLQYDRSDGDFKGGPDFGPGNQTLSWKTGGHHRSDTTVTVQARVKELVAKEELLSAYAEAIRRGVPAPPVE